MEEVRKCVVSHLAIPSESLGDKRRDRASFLIHGVMQSRTKIESQILQSNIKGFRGLRSDVAGDVGLRRMSAEMDSGH